MSESSEYVPEQSSPEGIASSPNLDQQVNAPDAGTKKHKCCFENCGRAFDKKAKLDRHVLTHTRERPFACDHPGCTKTFTRLEHLRRHRSTHDPTVERLECDHPGCNLTFALPQHLERHKNLHLKPRPYVCDHPGCSESFTKLNQLRRHKCVHTGLMPYTCPVPGCSFGSQYPSQLKKHTTLVHEVKRYICSYEDCGKEFEDPNALRQHIKSAHPPEPLWCHKCMQEFTTSAQLSRHLKQEHDIMNALNYPCPYDGCSRSYTKKSNLTDHIRSVHMAERPFVCTHPGCTSRFSHRYLLTRHRRIHASAGSPLICVPAAIQPPQVVISPSLLPTQAIDSDPNTSLADTLFGRVCSGSFSVPTSTSDPTNTLSLVPNLGDVL